MTKRYVYYNYFVCLEHYTLASCFGINVLYGTQVVYWLYDNDN